MKKTGSRQHCLGGGVPNQVSAVPGLSQVLSACELLAKADVATIIVSIASSERDAELIELSQEAAEQSGISMEFESSGGALVLRFTRDTGR